MKQRKILERSKEVNLGNKKLFIFNETQYLILFIIIFKMTKPLVPQVTACALLCGGGDKVRLMAWMYIGFWGIKLVCENILQ